MAFGPGSNRVPQAARDRVVLRSGPGVADPDRVPRKAPRSGAGRHHSRLGWTSPASSPRCRAVEPRRRRTTASFDPPRGRDGEARRAWHVPCTLFSEDAGSSTAPPLHRRGRLSRLDPDAEPSRKERGQRGVRPRHRNQQKAFGPEPGKVPQAAWIRVAFVNARVGGPAERPALARTKLDTLEWVLQHIHGDDRLRRGRFVWMVASRGPGRPRKTPGKTISADSHEYALAA